MGTDRLQIKKVVTYCLSVPIKPDRVITSTLGTHLTSDMVLLRMETTAGIDGVGEATVTPRWSGESARAAQAMIDDVLAPQVVGADPRNPSDIDARMDAVCRHNWSAKAAIEMACWDIAGQDSGRPVLDLLGGAARSPAIRSRYSMGAYSPEVARRRAQQLLEAGFTTIKIKVGIDVDASIHRVRAVREAVGNDVDLVIDANCGFDADEAIRCAAALSDCRLSLFEQPTPDGDYAAMARVRREIEPPVMADDMCFDLVHAKELIRNEACDVISVYPGKNGGIGKSRDIVALAAEHGLACSIGSNLEGDVATAAMAHLVAATKNIQVETLPGDMLGPDYHAVSFATNPVPIDGPITTVPSGPGLGVGVDWSRVEAAARARGTCVKKNHNRSG